MDEVVHITKTVEELIAASPVLKQAAEDSVDLTLLIDLRIIPELEALRELRRTNTQYLVSIA